MPVGNPPHSGPARQPRLQIPLLGLRRSGKSSMLNVVFNDLHPDDTLFLESTLRPSNINSDPFLPIALTDMPGGLLIGANKLEKGLPLAQSTQRATSAAATQQQQQRAVNSLSPDPSSSVPARAPSPFPAAAAGGAGTGENLLLWTDVSAVIFVIDAQDDYFEALSKLHSVILSAFAENQTIDFHVFIHKIDGYSDDYRQETLADIRGKVLDDLVDSSPSFVAQPWSFPVPLGGGSGTGAAGGKKESGAGKSRSKSRDYGARGSGSPAPNGGSSGGGGGSGSNNERGGYDASASEFSLGGGRGNNDSGITANSAGVAGQINLESAVRLHFHLTSIFDTSVFVAFSKVQQTLMQKTKSVESDTTAAAAAANHTLKSSRYLAPPSSTNAGGGQGSTPSPLGPSSSAAALSFPSSSTLAESVETLCDSICASCKFDKAFLFDLPTRTFPGSDSTPFDNASFDVIFEYAGFLSKFAGLYANLTPSSQPPSTPNPNGAASGGNGHPFPSSALSPPAPARTLASSVARLGPETSLAFWQLNERLALITILKTDVHARQAGLIDYNVCFFQRAVVRLLDVVLSGA